MGLIGLDGLPAKANREVLRLNSELEDITKILSRELSTVFRIKPKIKINGSSYDGKIAWDLLCSKYGKYVEEYIDDKLRNNLDELDHEVVNDFFIKYKTIRALLFDERI